MNRAITARAAGLARCHDCGRLARPAPDGHGHCRRCGAALHIRKPESVSRTWALLITAIILYFPANLLPIMTVTSFGGGEPDTIMSGVILLIKLKSYLVAAVVFIASVLVPLLKMLAILLLLLRAQGYLGLDKRQSTKLYRVVELVGRWSMLDLFVIALLVTLVNFGAVAKIVSGPAATAFGAVVVLTMLAAESFDARLIWDNEDIHEN